MKGFGGGPAGLLRYDSGAKRPTLPRIHERDYDRHHDLRKTGKKPVGRAFWTFRIVSPTVTFKDHVFTTDKPVTFQAAMEKPKRKQFSGLPDVGT
jgi:hypothetical protein